MVTESSWLRISSELPFQRQKHDTLCVLRDDTCAPPPSPSPDVIPWGAKRHSLWDMNKDVLSAVGGPDEAVTLRSREVLAHALEHGTWVSAHRPAHEHRRVWTLSQKGGESPRTACWERTGRRRNGGGNRLTLSRCACVWSVEGSAGLWAAAALLHLPTLGSSPSGRGRRGPGMCWESAAASPRATWGSGPPWRQGRGGGQCQMAPLLPGADSTRASVGCCEARGLSRFIEVSGVASSLSEGTCCGETTESKGGGGGGGGGQRLVVQISGRWARMSDKGWCSWTVLVVNVLSCDWWNHPGAGSSKNVQRGSRSQDNRTSSMYRKYMHTYTASIHL